ncbi:hypothetical protein Tco_0875096 [Tanacetum coccineum]|uniref:Uncharacterized protein n=1 Tax=Tanacetum coccineum TaxID=301880 RepID=A0ABQ5BNH3_9ASTR
MIPCSMNKRGNSVYLKSQRPHMYVVPTGRVIATVSIKVPTGRNIVPAGYIISPGLKDLSRAETYKWYQSLERVSVEE